MEKADPLSLTFYFFSEKELSIRRTQPSSRSDVTASGTPRKQSLEQMSVIQRSEKSSRRDRESFQANSLQGVFDIIFHFSAFWIRIALVLLQEET